MLDVLVAFSIFTTNVQNTGKLFFPCNLLITFLEREIFTLTWVLLETPVYSAKVNSMGAFQIWRILRLAFMAQEHADVVTRYCKPAPSKETLARTTDFYSHQMLETQYIPTPASKVRETANQ